MTAPRVIVRYFGAAHWDLHARVLGASLRRHCPGWALDIQAAQPKVETSPLGLHNSVVNTQKLDLWAEAVAAAADGDRLLLLDADTVVLRPLDPVWATPFDLAYTVKQPGARFPFNGGVIFLRVTAAARAFMAAWQAENRRMLEDPQHHQVWRPAYGGQNQSALGALFHQRRVAGTVLRLPCVEWNCEDESWDAFDPTRTRILHCKGELQRAIRRQVSPSGPVRPLLALWRQLAAAQEDPASAPVPLVEHGDPRTAPSPIAVQTPAVGPVAHGDPAPASPRRGHRRARRAATRPVGA